MVGLVGWLVAWYGWYMTTACLVRCMNPECAEEFEPIDGADTEEPYCSWSCMDAVAERED